MRGEALTDWLQALDFSLTINNLTDEDYLGGISGNAAWIGAPRSMIFTVTADF
jgi:outer membrane receptor for monomeric catechols